LTLPNNERVETFTEIDPEPLPEGAQPPHLWVRPIKPWDEDYTIAITSRETSSTQRIRVGCSDQTREVFFAIRVVAVGKTSPQFTCRDQPFEGLSEWKSDKKQPCSSLVPPSPQFEAVLYPRPYILTLPSSLIDMTPYGRNQGLQLIGRAFACPTIKLEDVVQAGPLENGFDPTLLIEVLVYNFSLFMLILFGPTLLLAFMVRRLVARRFIAR
jgi:hypothetical protein